MCTSWRAPAPLDGSYAAVVRRELKATRGYNTAGGRRSSCFRVWIKTYTGDYKVALFIRAVARVLRYWRRRRGPGLRCNGWGELLTVGGRRRRAENDENHRRRSLNTLFIIRVEYESYFRYLYYNILLQLEIRSNFIEYRVFVELIKPPAIL